MDRPFDLDQLKIAKPCSASWASMKGDDRRRFCAECKKNVYNVAGMTERQVKDLVAKSETLPCLRLTRRADGTVLTRDCPVGVARFRTKLAMAFCACLAFGFTMATAALGREKKQYDGETMSDLLRSKPVVGPIIEAIDPQPAIMGRMAVPVTGKYYCQPSSTSAL